MSASANRKYQRDWYSRPGNAEKKRELSRAYRAEHAEQIQERRGQRQRTPEGRARNRAHQAVWYAVDRGKIERQPCEICGALEVHAHHEDYAKPLEVRWLCAKHHGEAHRKP